MNRNWFQLSVRCDTSSLIKELEKLGPKAKPLLRKTLRPLANKVKNDVRKIVPKRTGALRKSISVKPVKSRRFYTVGFKIEPGRVGADKETGKGGNYYAFAPEYGVKRGRGKQKEQAYFLKAAQIAEASLPAVREAIAKAVADTFNATQK